LAANRRWVPSGAAIPIRSRDRTPGPRYVRIKASSWCGDRPGPKLLETVGSARAPAAGLAFPFRLGIALTDSLVGGLTGLLWGGAVRIFLVHHATFSINSLCHFFGRRPFATGDESRNLAWLAPLSLGEAWHNIHHAFPTSARHGLGRWQLDPSAWLITALERCRLAWGPSADHARTPTSQARRLITAQRAGQGLRVNSTEEGVMVLA
jgi:hypothetical protein